MVRPTTAVGRGLKLLEEEFNSLIGDAIRKLKEDGNLVTGLELEFNAWRHYAKAYWEVLGVIQKTDRFDTKVTA